MRPANGTVVFRRLEKAIPQTRRHRFATGEDVMVTHFTLDTGNVISAWPFPEGYEVFHTFVALHTNHSLLIRCATAATRWFLERVVPIGQPAAVRPTI